MIGVNFQPGTQDQNGTGNGPRRAPQNVQEAIKVLSLRLPRHPITSGAVAPAPLLESRGGGSSPVANSVVQSILQRMFPQAAPPSASVPQPSAPMIPSGEVYGGGSRTFNERGPQMGGGDGRVYGGGSPTFDERGPVIDANGIPPATIGGPAPPVPFIPNQPPMPTYPSPRGPERQEPSIDTVPDFWRRFPHVIVGPNPNEPPPDMPLPSFPVPREVPLTGDIPDWLRFGRFFGGGGGEDSGGTPMV